MSETLEQHSEQVTSINSRAEYDALEADVENTKASLAAQIGLVGENSKWIEQDIKDKKALLEQYKKDHSSEF